MDNEIRQKYICEKSYVDTLVPVKEGEQACDVNADNSSEITESKTMQVGNWLIETAIGGFGPFSSAEDLAQQYIDDITLKSKEEKVNALIKWETAKNFSTGFVTGLGGFATLPITIPASLGASWLYQTRMVAAIAKINGFDLNDERVKIMILCTLIGQDIKEVLKQVGVKIAQQMCYGAIKRMPLTILAKINKIVGFRLVTKAGEKSFISLTKLVPVVGGVVGGTVDAFSCRLTAKIAKKIFSDDNSEEDNIIDIQAEIKEDPIKDILEKIDYEVLKIDNDIIETVISSNSALLQKGFSNSAIVLSDFNRILDMYNVLQEYPEDMQKKLKKLLTQTITNYARITQMYVLYASGKMNKIDDLATQAIKYSMKSIAAGSYLAEQLISLPITTKYNEENFIAYSDIKSISATSLRKLSDDLLFNIIPANYLSFMLNEKINIGYGYNFMRSVELIIEKLNRYQDTIEKSLIISEMISDYAVYACKKKYASPPAKPLNLDFTTETFLFIPGLIIFLIWWGVAGIVSIFCKVNWVKTLAIPVVIMSLPVVYYFSIKICIPIIKETVAAIVASFKIRSMLKYYGIIAKKFYD